MKDRREFERVEYHVEMTCNHVIKPDGSDVTLKTPARMVMLDLSIGGIGIVSDIDFELSSILTFTLYLEKVPHTIMARVQWKAIKGEMCQCGLEFIGTPNQLFRQLQKIIKEKHTVFIEYA